MNQDDNLRTLLIWDKEGVPPKGNWTTVLWSDFNTTDDPNVISTPKLVEDQADILKTRYLAWIYELGETQVRRKRLIDHLELRPNFSYWWMTLLVEKSIYKSPRIFDVLRLLALENLTGELVIRRIILLTNDRVLVRTFKCWSSNAGIYFECKIHRKHRSLTLLKNRFYNIFPFPARAFFSLIRYLLKRWSLKQKDKNIGLSSVAQITFFDYFDNLDEKSLSEGRFSSFYWANLPEILSDLGLSQSWVHIYDEKNDPMSSFQSTLATISKFQQTDSANLNHSLLDEKIEVSVILKALKDYLTIMRFGLRVKNIKTLFSPAGSKINLWPLFKDDWHNSFYGPTAIWNCLFLNFFESLLKGQVAKKIGFYLQENQGWEYALNYSWKSAGHGKLVGVPHSTIRYWDLRYFFDPRSFYNNYKNCLPRPDLLALNGSAAINSYRLADYPSDEIVEVEALRYLYLTKQQDKRIAKNEDRKLKVLVMGDYLLSTTNQQMKWLELAFNSLPTNTQLILKPHPNCPINVIDYPTLKISLVNCHINELLKDCDVAYTSNATSAAVDVYLKGIPVVSMLESGKLNMSPLRGFNGVHFVSSPEELSAALKTAGESSRKPITEDYFTIDYTLARWTALIKQLT